jgi:hypothetical protein
MDAVSARLALIGAAGQTVTYGELARDLGLRMGELTATLEALMEEDAALGRPLRAAVCAARLGAGKPAPGFFQKAAALGFDVSDPGEFVAHHRSALALTRP